MSKYKTRYFNTIEESDISGILVKKSSDTEKIVEEYNYWYSLPENLQSYFVRPFDLKIEHGSASYHMEEVLADNAGAQLAAGVLSESSFRSLFARIVEFKETAALISKTHGDLDIDLNSKFLVLEKTENRINDLKKTYWICSHYSMSLDSAGISLPTLYSKLFKLFTEEYSNRGSKYAVLSHGDLTLSNVLWDSSTGVFKLIDPRGNSYMYMDEYYDLAKLSQSVNGRYEDIIHGEYELDIISGEIFFPREQDKNQQKIFNDYIVSQGLNFRLLRIYEASLFLSMLPMHLDDPQRIAAFLVNCNLILNNL